MTRVLVVGAGIGGLAAAGCFGRRGAEVDLVEIRSENSVPGVGLDTTANGARVLRELGILEDCQAVGYTFDSIEFCDRLGTSRLRLSSRMAVDGLPANLGISRRVLHGLLLQAAEQAGARLRLGVGVETLEALPDAVAVTFSDGRSNDYDLVVSCEGLRSPTRRRLFGTAFEPTYTGYVVWRASVPRPPGVVGHVMYQGDGVKAGVCPISSEEMYLLVVTAESDARPPREDYRVLLEQRLAPFGGLIADIRRQLPGPEQVVYSPIEEVRLPSPWYRGRVVVIGDGAHACAPHLAQGASMAMEDASVLAELCASGQDVPDGLAEFTRRRSTRVDIVQQASLAVLLGEMQNAPDEVLDRAVRELPQRSAELQLMLRQPASPA